jgi:DNA-binding GntR family transcriptional regulator
MGPIDVGMPPGRVGGARPARGGEGANEGPATLHSRVATALRSRIASRELPPHFRLKPEPELAVELGVSRGTLRRALRDLIAEGALVQVRGRGTFVTSTVVEPAIAQKLSTLSQDFADHGVPLTTSVRSVRLVAAPAPVGALLGVGAGDPILELVRLRSTTAGPVALLANYVRTDRAPGIQDVDFEAETLFGALSARFGLEVSAGRRTFTATAADEDQAALLEVGIGSPLLHLEQVTYLADGSPIEYSDVWIRSDRMPVTSLLSRP